MAYIVGVKTLLDMGVAAWLAAHGQWKLALLFGGYFVADYASLMLL